MAARTQHSRFPAAPACFLLGSISGRKVQRVSGYHLLKWKKTTAVKKSSLCSQREGKKTRLISCSLQSFKACFRKGFSGVAEPSWDLVFGSMVALARWWHEE